MTFIVEEDSLQHYGILRKSGRYPWGSGDNPAQRSKTFFDIVKELRELGMTDTEIAKAHGMTSTEFRNTASIARNAKRAADQNEAKRLKDKGMSNVEIGKRMGIPDTSVGNLLRAADQNREDVLNSTVEMLKRQVDEKKYVDVGVGVERNLDIPISNTKLSTALAVMKDQGYSVHRVKIDQLGTRNQTEIKVLVPPGVTQKEAWMNRGNIRQISEFTEDGGRTWLGIQPPLSINSKRLAINYKEDGGAAADGVIFVRPGVKDLDLGGSRYAQVRIAIDGTHYIKGMAMYKDDLPPGTDLMFNTNKSKSAYKLDALKPLKDDPDNPFGSAIKRQIIERSARGKETVTSAMNIVNEEGDWDRWSKTLSSQMLSKQSPRLAKRQLDLTFEERKTSLDEILALTNPAVRRTLLDSFAGDADAAAVHLKAKALPNTLNHVILPISSMKPNEIYAPNYKNGERVVLIRHPHGGIFEIPELVVNNNRPEAKAAIGRAKDAVGIHHSVAEKLSGADFDGDTVLVIPNNHGQVKTADSLKGLIGFSGKDDYPAYEGMPKMDARTRGLEMGKISNLITDMTIQGAPPSELVRAVRHSMVVIDAEKHNLNYRLSAINNGIPQLKEKYQGSGRAGASTLISRAKSEIRVPERKPRPASEGGPIDRATGKLVFVPTGATRTTRSGKVEVKKIKSEKLAETDDAHTLSSGTPIEKVYADHSNKLKALANQARLEMVHTKSIPYSPSAKTAYHKEVASLDAKLDLALRNAPRERQAQVLANAQYAIRKRANPEMDRDEEKKIKSQLLAEARTRTGAKKTLVKIEDEEWKAIQAGAITNNKLTAILKNADLDEVKKLATPKRAVLMTSTKIATAQTMLASGYTQAEVAERLGVSLTTLKNSLGGG